MEKNVFHNPRPSWSDRQLWTYLLSYCESSFSDHWEALFDIHPVTRGHVLIISKRNVRTLFECSDEEMKSLFEVMKAVRGFLTREYGCDGFNWGVNEGSAAGQTIAVLHVHVIPRYKGDMEDPTGGVRGVIPGKQTY